MSRLLVLLFRNTTTNRASEPPKWKLMAKKPWEGRSFSEEEYQEAIFDLKNKLQTDPSIVENELRHLLNMSVPIEQAKESVIHQYARTYSDVDEYERFDVFEGEVPPPKIDEEDWFEYDTDTGSRELREIGNQLQAGYQCAVYCVSCEVLGETLRDAELRAKERLNDLPAWVRRAYKADQAFYIGQSADLAHRLETHAVGRMRESTPPSKLTRISKTKAVGIIDRVNDRGEARVVEELYAENFKDVTEDDDSVFIYQQ